MSLLPPLATISLAALQSEAELLTRVDRKYLLPLPEATRALAGLGEGSRVLEIEGRTRSDYASTYFDTPERDSFRSTATARRRRWKVRTRSYLDSGDCWVEVKTRGPRGLTVKERAPHPPEASQRITGAAVTWVEERLRAARAYHRPWLGLPVLSTTYSRSTILLPEGGARATIDTDLTWLLPDGTTTAPRDAVVIETKTTGTPSAFDRALWRAGHRPTRISKFGTGLALLDPTVPANRWHRLFADDGVLTS
ncbi:polyphosphate polymerase domain-containing protein [Ornithinimicrobium sp. F0845]|uniref:polyphosphate polymerase domain-containing protein n=1 Tax=Ornithinimicrobium sp. F0845 TaxID=2926412 RepID=UPI001FF2C61A|nr:polyphosphate polymerase domain-containing protein [Ornithinimicrobium sp. F0845]MCK0113301.1 polyphosphate polymerase domain-containing protein [Ornithinimicrobium sp. F0845]